MSPSNTGKSIRLILPAQRKKTKTFTLHKATMVLRKLIPVSQNRRILGHQVKALTLQQKEVLHGTKFSCVAGNVTGRNTRFKRTIECDGLDPVFGSINP